MSLSVLLMSLSGFNCSIAKGSRRVREVYEGNIWMCNKESVMNPTALLVQEKTDFSDMAEV